MSFSSTLELIKKNSIISSISLLEISRNSIRHYIGSEQIQILWFEHWGLRRLPLGVPLGKGPPLFMLLRVHSSTYLPLRAQGENQGAPNTLPAGVPWLCTAGGRGRGTMTPPATFCLSCVIWPSHPVADGHFIDRLRGSASAILRI